MISSVHNKELSSKFTRVIRKNHEDAAALHEPSGRLSAGQLGKPLLEQVLKIIGVPGKPVDDYALGIFLRGNTVEDTVISLAKSLGATETQKEVMYRGVIGYIDLIVDGDIIEVKSIKNSQVDYIDPECDKKVRSPEGLVPKYSGPKWAHVLQGGLYALAEKKDTFTVLYVSADDFRTYPHVINTADVKTEIDNIINEVATQLKTGQLPAWKAREDWQDKYREYSAYPEWIELDPETAMGKLERQFPDAFRKLQSFIPSA